MSKPGRNDPCPCGSGRKYKKCCMRASAPTTAEFVVRKMRSTENELTEQLIRHARRYYGDACMAEAWDEFTLWNDWSMDPDSLEEFAPTFVPWFLFNWIPDNAERQGELLPETPVALHYLAHKGSRLAPFARRYIEAACAQPYSFFQVVSVEPGSGMLLRDVMLQRESSVVERAATEILRPGYIIYSRLVSLDGTTVMLGCAGTVIPSSYLAELIDVREKELGGVERLDQAMLIEYDLELRDVFIDIRGDLQGAPSFPELRNTDDEPLQPTTQYYRLECAPREAFDSLKSLAVGAQEHDLLSEAVHDATGDLQGVEFPWLKRGNKAHSSWDNTVMGHVHIDGDQLKIEVNSQARADTIRDKVERLLGDRVEYQRAVIQSPEKMLEDLRSSGQVPAAPDDDALNAMPDVQALLKKQSAAHWREWPDTALPALDGQTPRQAAQSPRGRELLDGLLLDFEGRADPSRPDAPDVAALRRELGMD